MKHPALKELYTIMKTEDWTSFCPEKHRVSQLDEWIDKWIVEVDNKIDMVNPKLLNSEDSDFMKYTMGKVLGEVLTEECVSYQIDKKSITARMVGLKRGKV